MRPSCILYLWLSQFQACPSPLPPGRFFQAFVILSVPAVWNLSENLCPGMGHLSFFSDSYRYFCKEYFQYICFERQVLVFGPSPPYPTVFLLQPSNNLLPAIVISSHLEEKIIDVSFEEFKGRDTLFVSGWLRQEGPEKLCEIFES